MLRLIRVGIIITGQLGPRILRTETAGLTTLKLLNQPGVYEKLEQSSAYLFDEMDKLAAKHQLPTTWVPLAHWVTLRSELWLAAA